MTLKREVTVKKVEGGFVLEFEYDYTNGAIHGTRYETAVCTTWDELENRLGVYFTEKP